MKQYHIVTYHFHYTKARSMDTETNIETWLLETCPYEYLQIRSQEFIDIYGANFVPMQHAILFLKRISRRTYRRLSGLQFPLKGREGDYKAGMMYFYGSFYRPTEKEGT